MDTARKIALKYRSQLVLIANEKATKAEAPAPTHVETQPDTWAQTARIMAQGDDSGFDWGAWKDEMKER